MSETLEYMGTLTVVTCWCGIKHAVPAELRNYQLRQHRDGKDHGVYCPLGHSHCCAGEGEAAKLQRQLTAERARHDQTKAALQENERRLIAEKGVKTKLKKRIAAGVCPCCHRSFVNLQRHMAGKHPDYTKD